MIWPFKRAPRMTLDEAVADKPMPPCGNKRQHYNLIWQGVPCFDCEAKREIARRARDEDRLAEKIAQRVAQKLHDHQCAAKGK